MKISFMTLGCPDWDLREICRRGKEFGYDGIDFRGVQDSLDITVMPEFTSAINETRSMLDDAGLAVSAISSSITLCAADKLATNLEEAKRTIPVALNLDSSIVRVFGGGDLEQYSRQDLVNQGRDCLNQILNLDGAERINWLFETHDNWISSHHCVTLIQGVDSPNIGVLWDIGHTSRVGGETPEETFEVIKDHIGYIHIKDAIYDTAHPHAMDDGWRYVLPGTGQLPLTDGIACMRQHGYQGWFQFEHEKRWHPDLAEPELAFAAFANFMRSLG